MARRALLCGPEFGVRDWPFILTVGLSYPTVMTCIRGMAGGICRAGHSTLLSPLRSSRRLARQPLKLAVGAVDLAARPQRPHDLCDADDD